MTDFDAKIAELEANSDRVPELKMVVELFRMSVLRRVSAHDLLIEMDRRVRAIPHGIGIPDYHQAVATIAIEVLAEAFGAKD